MTHALSNKVEDKTPDWMPKGCVGIWTKPVSLRDWSFKQDEEERNKEKNQEWRKEREMMQKEAACKGDKL